MNLAGLEPYNDQDMNLKPIMLDSQHPNVEIMDAIFSIKRTKTQDNMFVTNSPPSRHQTHRQDTFVRVKNLSKGAMFS